MACCILGRRVYCANTFAVANGSMIEGAVDFFVVGYSGAQSSMASAVVIIGALRCARVFSARQRT